MKRKVAAFWKDEGGVSVVLGALLMFVLVVSMYATIQSYQVPIWNAEVEWEHLDTVNDDMMTLKSDIEDVALLKVPKSSNIKMGMRYPSRIFLVNPGPGVTGTLTSESVNVTVQYTLDVPGNPTFTRTYGSNRIAYQARGTVNSPRLIYEHGLMLRDFGNAALSTAEQSLVVNEEIFLPLLVEGSLSLSSMETKAVALRPLTESFTSAKVQSVTVTLDTGYPQAWEEALAGAASANTTITVNHTAKTVVIESTAIKQIVFPSGNVTANALYAGMINLSTKFVPGTFTRIDITKAYPHITDIVIKAVGTKEEQLTHSTITATVKNTAAPFEIFADLTGLTGNAASYPVFPDTSSPNSISATSWAIPNENTVQWTNITHPAFRPDDAIMVSFWVYNTENYMVYFTTKVFTRRTDTSWAPIHIYALRGKDSRDFWRYDVGINTRTTIQPTPANVKEGGALTFDGSYIYALRGSNTPEFWRYDIASNTWTARAATPANVKEGGALTFGGSYIYALGGSDTTEFWTYGIASNTWTARAATPDIVKDGGALTFDGSYIYALRGKDTQEFWRYDITTNTWTRMTDMLDKVNWGGALIFVIVE